MDGRELQKELSSLGLKEETHPHLLGMSIDLASLLYHGWTDVEVKFLLELTKRETKHEDGLPNTVYD